MELTRAELEKKSVQELRELVRKYKIALGLNVSGVEIAGAGKEKLIGWLLNETVPASGTNGNNGTSGTNGTSENNTDLASIIAAAIQDKIVSPAASIDESQVIDIVDAIMTDKMSALKAELEAKTVKIIEVKQPDKETVKVGKQHKDFEKILKLAMARINVMLVGPAGSGKTHLAESIAKSLELPFYFIPVGMQTTKSDLLGYLSADGKYVPSLLRMAYENGGVFLLDEVDAGNPNVLTVINALLSNGLCGFPDGMVRRHEDFIFLCAGNTYGKGADRQYVGRNQLDAATLNRFAVHCLDYDEDLEMDLAENKDWCKRVQAIRKTVFNLKEKLVVSPRASFTGSKMLALGMDENEVLDAVIFQGINAEIKNRVLAAA